MPDIETLLCSRVPKFSPRQVTWVGLIGNEAVTTVPGALIDVRLMGKQRPVESWIALLLVLVLAVAHIGGPLLPFLTYTPRSAALSAGAGVSVAYVVVHLLPEIAEAQEAVERHGVLAQVERHAYVVALAGLVLFYGIEHAVLVRAEQEDRGTDLFWVGIISFALYNSVIGYLVVRTVDQEPFQSAVVLTLALGLHFVVNDAGLRQRHRGRYDRAGRPLLLGALFLGWLVGVTVDVPDRAVGLATAFLAGGIVLNVLKEELPAERKSRLLPFVLGASAYTVILLIV